MSRHSSCPSRTTDALPACSIAIFRLSLRSTFATSFTIPIRNAYNTIAEIPGGDKKGEIVMLGAHLDSWHAGTGATDNAAGSAVVMEAIRILKAIGFKPRRTIRVGLWSGEEQGLLGSTRVCGRTLRLARPAH